MKKLFSTLFIVVSIILCRVSICDISNLDCLKGDVPIQQIFTLETTNFYAIANHEAKIFQPLIPLFYVSILFLVLNSLIRFDKEFTIRDIINIFIVLAIATYIIISHNYVYYLGVMNIYFLYNVITHYTKINITCIITSMISTALCCACIIMLYKHFRLATSFEYPNIFQPMVQSSKCILTIFELWIIPYTVLGIKALHKYNK